MSENLQRNINFWDAKLYLEKADPQFQLAYRALKKYNFKGNELILDVGCGPGNITAQLAKKVSKGRVIGIDPAKNMIDFAQQAYMNVKNVSFEYKNVLNFSFPEKFQLITSFSAMHWVINQEAALARMYNHLSNDGALLVVMIPMRDVEPINEALMAVVNKEEWQSCFEKFSPPLYFDMHQEAYQQLLRKLGFELNYFEAKQTMVPFETIDAMAKWFESWSTHRIAIPAQLRFGFYLALAQEYLKITNQSNTLQYHYATWEFLAHKSKQHRLFHTLVNKLKA